jgi:hypothetical protein
VQDSRENDGLIPAEAYQLEKIRSTKSLAKTEWRRLTIESYREWTLIQPGDGQVDVKRRSPLVMKEYALTRASEGETP